jgi:hypothetical protein
MSHSIVALLLYNTVIRNGALRRMLNKNNAIYIKEFLMID